MATKPTGNKRGRPRKPSHLKAIENQRFKGLPEDEPQPDIREPEMPDWLSDDGKEIWIRLLPKLLNASLITEVDGTAYGLFCQAYADLAEIEKFKQGGPMIKTNVNDEGMIESTTVFQHVYLARDLRAQVHRYGCQLGMSPASRSGLSIEPLPKNDPYAEWQKRKAASAKKRLS